MRHLFHAILLGASLALSCVASAPARAQDALVQQIAERDREVSAAVRRAGDIVADTLGQPRFTSPDTPWSLAATVAAEAETLVAARAELLQISRSLHALPPLAGPDRPADLGRRDLSRESTATLIAAMAEIFDHVLTMPALAEAGDEPGLRAAYRSAMAAGSLQQTMQAVGLRGAAAELPHDSVQNAKLLGLACLSESLVAFQAGVLGTDTRDDALQAMTDAETCIADNVRRGRGYVAAAAPDAEADIYSGYFDVLADGALWIAEVRRAYADGMHTGRIAALYNRPYGVLVDRIQQLIVRENALIAARMGAQ